MQESEIYFSHMLDTGSGFAARTDTGEQAFVPASVVKASSLMEGDIAKARLIPNTHPNNAATPWVAIFVTKGALSQVPKDAPKDSLDERVMRILSETAFASTSEIADDVAADVSLTHNSLLRLFKAKRVVKADVFADPAQERASICLWATEVRNFLIGEEAEEEV